MRMPCLEIFLVMGPVMLSEECKKASSGVMPCLMYRRKRPSTMACTAPNRIPAKTAALVAMTARAMYFNREEPTSLAVDV